MPESDRTAVPNAPELAAAARALDPSSGRGPQDEHARLVEANNLFQAIYDQGLFAGRIDLAGTLLDANRSSLEQCGYTRADVIGKPFWECGWWNRAPEVQTWVRDAVLQAIAGTPFRGVSRYFWADGSTHIVDFACVPLRDESGAVRLVVPTGMDITQQIAVTRNLHATEILESITEGFFGVDRQWRFTYLNGAAQRILDRTAEELLGRVIWEVYPHLVGSNFERAYRRAMVRGEASSVVAYYADHGRWYEVHPYPAADGISVYFRDVTEQKWVEIEREQLIEASEQQRRMYEAALSNTPDLVYVFDLDHRFTYANEALLRVWGRRREEALGKNCLELGYEPWHAAMHDREIEQVVATRKPIRGEVPFTGTDGRRVYDYIFVPVFGAGHKVVAVAGTTRDITERQQTEQAIREQAQRLHEADRAKDEFLATLAHELRNPLAPLRNSLALLRLTSADAATTSIREMMDRQVNHLVRLVDDLLEMSRISRGALELRKERVEIATVIRNAIETSEPLVRAANHELAVSLSPEPLWVEGDPVRLAQVLSNLLNNAAKYTDEGGHIAVAARAEADRVAISIRDDGVGIAPEEIQRMFDMFSRGDRAKGRAQTGLGIGLTLARRLAEMHDGSLDANSEGLGKGSTFTLRLPLAPPAMGEERLGDARLAAEIPHRRVLVVDDNRDAGESLGSILQLLGAEVRVVHDGPAALEAIESYAPAVVLLDIGMPGMDGYEVAREIRSRSTGEQPSIIALTGWGQEDDRRRARDAGFDHHLIKPADLALLQELLASPPHAGHAAPFS